MKVLAVIALLATVAYASEDVAPASAHSEDTLPGHSHTDVVITANSADFIGELQESENGPIIQFGVVANPADGSQVQHGIPSCKLGKTLGNPICVAKCISRGNAGGYCDGRKCKCVN